MASSISPAPLGQRVVTYLLDIVAATLVLVPFLFGMSLVGAAEEGKLDLVRFYAFALPGFACVFAFLVLTQARGGTPGQRVMKIRVVDSSSQTPIGVRRAIVRQIVFIAELLPYGLGLLSILWGERGRAWHDTASGSIVVKADSAGAR